MKKLSIILIYLLFTSCVTNYYFVNVEEDTPIYNNTNGNGESITVIPRGYSAYIASGTKKHRKIKWKNYKGWAINPVYKNSVDASSSGSSSSYDSSKSNYRSSSSTSSGGTVHVKSYTRKDGTYVRSHTRSAPKRR